MHPMKTISRFVSQKTDHKDYMYMRFQMIL